MTTDLFVETDFVSHSGKDLSWKIECDSLTLNEWDCIAKMIMEYQHKEPFQAAIGIPRGGIKLSQSLHQYATNNPKDPYLIVDDVLTTGKSMEEYAQTMHYGVESNECIGWVVFARTTPPDWIKVLFQMPKSASTSIQTRIS